MFQFIDTEKENYPVFLYKELINLFLNFNLHCSIKAFNDKLVLAAIA